MGLDSREMTALRCFAASSKYGIGKNGFLPDEAPLRQLPHESYRAWEELIAALPQLLQDGERYRRLIDHMDTISTENLRTEAEWQRAYSMLCMLAQAYIWGGVLPRKRLPPQLSVPLLAASAHLEVFPVATYAALNLWNYRTVSPGLSLDQPENLTAMQTVTGTEAESWFYMVSNAMESMAYPIITTMLAAMDGAQNGDEPTVIAAFDFLSVKLGDIGALLERMDERCNPEVFFHQIRPMLAGSLNMGDAGLPNGIFFDEGEGKGSWRKYRGGSNGQSSLIQFFDIVLGVHHGSQDFHRLSSVQLIERDQEMRRYMPGPHARFLDDLEEVANLRSFVQEHQDRAMLVQAYNTAVKSLSSFRDKHIALVTRYIIVPSRKPKPEIPQKRNLAAINAQAGSRAGTAQEFVGTGGTKLVPFLRMTRDETTLSVLDCASRG